MTARGESQARTADSVDADADYLKRIGARVRAARARRGMTRKRLSRDSGVSERYLAELENGRGNISILLLRQIADAMHLPVEELARDGEDPPVEIALILEQLQRMDRGALSALHHELLARSAGHRHRHERIALIGLRGAGKSTLEIGRAHV